jgi:glycine/D-amino acid oxidase-like deaminating enzyme
MELSFWERDRFFPHFDIVIIGSGIVGLNAALSLKESNSRLRVAVLERGPIPAGASTRNAGFACFGSMSELRDDLNSMTEAAVFSLLEMRWHGLARLRARLGDAQLDYEPFGGFEVFTEAEEAEWEACMDQMGDFNRKLAAITGNPEVYRATDELIQRFGLGRVKRLICNREEGQLHAGKMMDALTEKVRLAGISLFFGLGVSQLKTEGHSVSVVCKNGWTLSAEQVLVATNGFAQELLPDLQVVPARNQVLVTQPVAGLKLKGAFHFQKGYYYFRNIGDRVLLGGGRHLDAKGEETAEFGFSPLIRNAQEELLDEMILPGLQWKVESRWSGIMGVGNMKSPIIREVQPGIWVAVRLGGMGVAIGSLVGEEAAEKMLGKA